MFCCASFKIEPSQFVFSFNFVLVFTRNRRLSEVRPLAVNYTVIFIFYFF